MSRAVLDASALLALFLGEPGGTSVAAIIARAAMSAVNLSEVASRLYDRGMNGAEVQLWVRRYEVEVVPFNREDALASAALRPLTRHLGLSLGDCACLALARRLGLPAMTADRAWSQLDLGIPVQVIR